MMMVVVMMMPFHSSRYLATLGLGVRLVQWLYSMCQHLLSSWSASGSLPSRNEAAPNASLTFSTPVCNLNRQTNSSGVSLCSRAGTLNSSPMALQTRASPMLSPFDTLRRSSLCCLAYPGTECGEAEGSSHSDCSNRRRTRAAPFSCQEGYAQPNQVRLA